LFTTKTLHYKIFLITKGNFLVNNKVLSNPYKLKHKVLFTKYYYSYINKLSKSCYIYIFSVYFKKYYNTFNCIFIYNYVRKLGQKNYISSYKKILLLSYRRNRFFPTINNNQGHTYITLSLGSFLFFFLKPKNFKKSKQMYFLLIHFLIKTLNYLNYPSVVICIKFIPKYLSEVVSLLYKEDSTIHNHPFSSITTKKLKTSKLQVSNIIFYNNKDYGTTKQRKKGVVKRKIIRKVHKNNFILD